MASRRNQFWLFGAKSKFMGRIKKAQMIEGTAKEPGWDELVHKCPSWGPLRLGVEGLGEGLTGPAWVSTPPCFCWQSRASMITGEGSVRPEWRKAISQDGFEMLFLEKSYGGGWVRYHSVYHRPCSAGEESSQCFIQKTTEVEPGL